MEIMHRLQQSIGIGIGTGVGTCTCIGDWDANYHLMIDGLVRFQDMIYVSDCSELKKLILREFHVNPYSGQPGYHKPLTAVKKFYYWSNLKKEVAEFMNRCLDCHYVKA